MPQFLTIGYGDEAGYQQTAQAVRHAAHEHDARLVADGAQTGVAGRPVQVETTTTAGSKPRKALISNRSCPLPASLSSKPRVSRRRSSWHRNRPCAVAHGVIEVWPLETLPN